MRLNFNNVGRGLSAIADAYTTKQKRKDLESIGPDAEAVEGQGYEVTAPDGTVSTGVLGKDANADLESIQQNYGEAGYGLKLLDKPQYAARAGSQDVGTYGTEAEAEKAAGKDNYGLMRQRAAVYEKYGDVDTANRLRTEARNAKREDARDVISQNQEARAAKSHDKQMAGMDQDQSLKGMQIKDAERKAVEQVNMDNFQKALSDLSANGVKVAPETLQSLAAANKLTLPQSAEVVAKYFDLDAGVAKARVQQRVTKAIEAAQTGGTKGLIEAYNEKGGLFDNGSDMVLKPAGGGKYILFDGDVQIHKTPMTEAEIGQMLVGMATDPFVATKFEVEMQQRELAAKKAALEGRKTESEINKNNAAASKDRAEASAASAPDGIKPEKMRLLVNDAAKALQGYFGGQFAGDMWIPDEKNRDAAMSALQRAEGYIQNGMSPMAAAKKSAEEISRGQVMDKIKGAKPSGAVDMMRNKFGY